jgi:hypothetical protein
MERDGDESEDEGEGEGRLVRGATNLFPTHCPAGTTVEAPLLCVSKICISTLHWLSLMGFTAHSPFAPTAQLRTIATAAAAAVHVAPLLGRPPRRGRVDPPDSHEIPRTYPSPDPIQTPPPFVIPEPILLTGEEQTTHHANLRQLPCLGSKPLSSCAPPWLSPPALPPPCPLHYKAAPTSASTPKNPNHPLRIVGSSACLTGGFEKIFGRFSKA